MRDRLAVNEVVNDVNVVLMGSAVKNPAGQNPGPIRRAK